MFIIIRDTSLTLCIIQCSPTLRIVNETVYFPFRMCIIPLSILIMLRSVTDRILRPNILRYGDIPLAVPLICDFIEKIGLNLSYIFDGKNESRRLADVDITRET